MVRLFASLALVGLVATSSVLAHDFSPCKGKSDTLGVSQLSFSPDPPLAGKEVTVNVGGKTPRRVDGGSVIAETRVMGFTVETDTYSLCETLNVPCPLEAGSSYVGTVRQLIPANTPDKMGATVRVTVKSATGEVLSCLESYVVVSNHGDPSPAETLGAAHDGGFGRKAVAFVFNAWKAKFPNAYFHHDPVRALTTFAENIKRVNDHNDNPSSTFTMALNEFAGMTADEFASQRLTGIKHRPKAWYESMFTSAASSMLNVVKLRGTAKRIISADIPDALDWTEKGAVTGVKNQGSCGSCWAFSAIGALESAYFIKTGKLLEFSEQELVSCDDSDFGCQGGLMDYAFAWVQKQGGLCSEGDYPYTSGQTSARGMCGSSTCTPVEGSVPTGFVDIPPTETALQAAVAEHGPVSVAIEADQAVFQFYHSGVLTGMCGTHLDHGVLLVGYGVDSKSGTPYWKVKNSWGANWGESGFVRIQRGKRWPHGGECGISSSASFPVL